MFDRDFYSYYPLRPSFNTNFLVLGFGYECQYDDKTKHVFKRKDLNSLHFILSGEGFIEKNGALYPVKAGQGFLLKGGENTIYFQSKENYWTTFWVDFSNTTNLQSILSLLDIKDVGIFSFLNSFDSASFIKELINNAPNYDSLYVNSKILEYFSLVRTCKSTSNNKINKDADENPLVNELKAYMEDNFHDSNFSIDLLCRKFAYSNAHITRLFTRSLKINPVKYLNQLRMEEAEILLINGFSIKHVSENVGFSSSSYFSKAFKKYFGMSPNEYKKFKFPVNKG